MHTDHLARSWLILSLMFAAIECDRPHDSTSREDDVMTRPSKPPDAAAIERIIDNLSNTDIHWDGTLVGLTPTVVSESARQLLAWGEVAIPHLINALADDSKFVAAHVVLTLVSGVEYHTIPWNGLKVDLLPDGQVKIDAAQRFDLARRWQKWQQAAPHPRSLPE